ncbi:MAG: ParB N-terminal domain-containing protein [Tepidisphaeraceae bacterium]
MNVETIAIDQLSHDPANVRRHSERNIITVVGSLRRFGQQIPLVIDLANVVRVGNCRLEGMRRLGWTSAQVVRTNLTGAELAAYSIADNRSGDPEVGSTFDTSALAEVLNALRAEDESLVADAGYSPDELAALFGQSINDQPVIPPDDFPEHDETIDTEHECPKCRYRWSGSSAPQGAA